MVRRCSRNASMSAKSKGEKSDSRSARTRSRTSPATQAAKSLVKDEVATLRRRMDRTVWWKIDSLGTASMRSRRCRSLSAWTPRLSLISEQPQNSKGCVAAEVAMRRTGSLLEIESRSTFTTTPSTVPRRFYRGAFRGASNGACGGGLCQHAAGRARGCAVAEIVMDQVCKIYPDGTKAVDSLDLDVGDGEFIVLVGPSGCGKTTALRMVAGLESISEGTIRIGDRVVNEVPPKDRDIAMVFQNYALYPHMTVYDNMAFGLKLRKLPKEEIDRRVREAAEILGLERLPEPQAQGAVGRPATAGGHGPGHRPRAEGVPHGRAAVQPRRQAPGPDALGDRQDPARPRHHHALRDPRPGRGHDDGRPRGRHRRASSSRSTPRRSCTTTRTTCSWPGSSARRP